MDELVNQSIYLGIRVKSYSKAYLELEAIRRVSFGFLIKLIDSMRVDGRLSIES